MREPTAVTLRIDVGGAVTVLAFTWQGRTLRVASRGREWQADDGHHRMVMTPDSRVFELLQTPGGEWFVVGASGRRVV